MATDPNANLKAAMVAQSKIPVKVHPDHEASRPDVYGGIINKVISEGSRIGLVAREARDIPTAIGTAINAPKGTPVGRNLRDQATDVVNAAVAGKKGTTSDQYVNPSKAVSIVDPSAKPSMQKGKQR
jgi:hypothetical protein